MKKTLVCVCATLLACGPPAATDPCKGRVAGDLVVTEMIVTIVVTIYRRDRRIHIHHLCHIMRMIHW